MERVCLLLETSLAVDKAYYSLNLGVQSELRSLDAEGA